ncbi:MAG: hypothetical protein ACLVBX_06285 [Faecalibacterium prausnitzii]
MTLTEVCAVLTVAIALLSLLVSVAKAAFDAGWKISHEKNDKSKKIDRPSLTNSAVNLFDLKGTWSWPYCGQRSFCS